MRPALVTAVLLLVALSFMKNSAAESIVAIGPSGVVQKEIPKNCERILSSESCDPGWYLLDGSHCMKEAPIKATFDDAESFCQSEGGHLGSMKMFWNYFRVMCMMAIEKSETTSYWIGARRQQDGTYEWTDGSGLVAFNPSDTNDCLELIYRARWNYIPCSSTRNFVCQKVI